MSIPKRLSDVMGDDLRSYRELYSQLGEEIAIRSKMQGLVAGMLGDDADEAQAKLALVDASITVEHAVHQFMDKLKEIDGMDQGSVASARVFLQLGFVAMRKAILTSRLRPLPEDAEGDE